MAGCKYFIISDFQFCQFFCLSVFKCLWFILSGTYFGNRLGRSNGNFPFSYSGSYWPTYDPLLETIDPITCSMPLNVRVSLRMLMRIRVLREILRYPKPSDYLCTVCEHRAGYTNQIKFYTRGRT